MAALISLLAAAVAPGCALMYYVYLKDRYESEPIRIIFRIFVVGMLSVFPIMIIERGLSLAFGNAAWVQAFVISGGVEEFFKWFFLYFLIFRHAAFDEPYDGIVYAVAVSLGFATMENVFYAFAAHSFSAMLLRALLPVSGHALFGMIMGYYIGHAKFAHSGARKYLLLSLALPAIWHGAFDFILLLSRGKWMWLIVPFMLLLWITGLSRIRRAISLGRDWDKSREIRL